MDTLADALIFHYGDLISHGFGIDNVGILWARILLN